MKLRVIIALVVTLVLGTAAAFVYQLRCVPGRYDAVLWQSLTMSPIGQDETASAVIELTDRTFKIIETKKSGKILTTSHGSWTLSGGVLRLAYSDATGEDLGTQALHRTNWYGTWELIDCFAPPLVAMSKKWP